MLNVLSFGKHKQWQLNASEDISIIFVFLGQIMFPARPFLKIEKDGRKSVELYPRLIKIIKISRL